MTAVYDELYCIMRNKLIPEAVHIANTRHGYKEKGPAVKEEFDSDWNYTYHQTMNRLAKERGITS
jgi:hypothetical protein